MPQGIWQATFLSSLVTRGVNIAFKVRWGALLTCLWKKDFIHGLK